MPTLFLIIQPESYDHTYVYGVFASFVEARAEAEKQWEAYHFPQIEEWDGADLLAVHQNYSRSPIWRKYRYDNPPAEPPEQLAASVTLPVRRRSS